MFNKVCILLLLQLCLLIGAATAEEITVVISPEARVEGAFITLGQLADISGADVTRVNSLRQLKLGSTALPGSSIVLSKELLGMRLAATGSDFRDIQWEIPDTVTVATNFQTVSGQVLNDKAILAIKSQAGLKSGNGEMSILPVGGMQDIIAPIGPLVLTSNLSSGLRYNMPTTVQMVINVNGQVVTKKSLKFDVKLYRQVAVATSPIISGEILTTGNLHYERMDIGRLGTGYFTDMNKVLGLETRRSLTPGMVVTDSMVNKPVLIKRGNLVNIVARVGSMEVTAAGQAMQNGIAGQLIRVRNINSTKIISGKVLDENTVQVLTYKSNGV